MAPSINAAELAKLGWQQGSILGPQLAQKASNLAPDRISVDDLGYVVVVSHDCDIFNHSLHKEPVVEVLQGRGAISSGCGQRSHASSGRNPRELRIDSVNVAGKEIGLDFSVHQRWMIPRQWLLEDRPAASLSNINRRLVAEWLAKRYIRPAFPMAFDDRWRHKFGAWKKLLKKHSKWIQAVYLRLDTNQELAEGAQYTCHMILAVPMARSESPKWASMRPLLEGSFTSFWDQFQPGISCLAVEVLSVDRITIADIERHQRLDADWVSFEDDTPVMPVETDYRE